MTLVSGFAEVCCFPCGRSTLMALGDTMVDVIMKKMSNRKMMSVIEAMLNVAAMWVFRFSAIGSVFNGFVEQVHEREGLGFQLVDHRVDFCHEIVVGKE